MDFIGIIKSLSNILSSTSNKSQQHQNILRLPRMESGEAWSRLATEVTRPNGRHLVTAKIFTWSQLSQIST